jgi:hypothetical protein
MEIKINDFDIRKKKYPLDVLIKNFQYLDITTLLHFQTLDADFCKKYILNDKYHLSFEDSYLITISYVLKKQPHLKYEDLVSDDDDDDDDDTISLP